MMTMACPNCGNPVRPGAKFCGNCGWSLAKGAPPRAATPQQPGGAVCPNCSNPVRKDARFCNHCGYELTKVGTLASASQVEPTVEPVAPATIQATAPAAVPMPEKTPKPSRGRVWIWALLGLIVIVCGLAGAAAYLYTQGPFGLFTSATDTLTPTSPATDTLTPQVTEISTQPVTDTPIPTDSLPPPTVTATVELTTTTETVAPAETETVGPTETGDLPTVSPETVMILQDNFSGNLDTNWNLWGAPPAQTDRSSDKPFLKLTGAPNSAGVTSLSLVPLRPGVVIQFAVLLPEEITQDALAFDWDPGEAFRQPGDGPGQVRVMIQNDKVVFQVPSPLDCVLQLEGEKDHVYTIKILNDMQIAFEVDVQVCPIVDSGVRRGGGRVSFSGIGAVDYIEVSR